MAETYNKFRSDDDGSFISIHFEQILPENHPAKFIRKFIETVNINRFEEKYKVGQGKIGRSPYDIRMMLCIILYGIYVRIYSAHKMEYATENYSDFWIFTHKNKISHDKISNFINLHAEEIYTIFLETIILAEKNNLLNFKALYQDGFFLKANASKSKNYNRKRLATRKEKLQENLKNLLSNLKDEKNEDINNQKKKLTLELDKIDELTVELNERIKIRSEKDSPSEKKKREEKSTINYTDKDSELNKMKDDSYANAYLKVTAIDSKADIIISSTVDGFCNEPQKTIPLVDESNKSVKGIGEYKKVCADAAFITMENCAKLEQDGISMIGPTKQYENETRHPDKYMIKPTFEYNEKKDCVKCSGGKILKHVETWNDKKEGKTVKVFANKEACKKCMKLKECTKSEYRKIKIDIRFPAQIRALERYKSKKGKVLYKKRAHVAETMQGDLKQNGKFQQLLRRGKDKATVDSRLHDITWNLRRIFNTCESKLAFNM